MNKPGSSTPERILHAAYGLFAAKGFDGATTQEICSLAQANIAAVNYHFGSKENLYRAVWEYGAAKAQRQWDEALSPALAPEEQLRQFIAWRVAALVSEDEGGWFARLIHREMSSPSPLAEELHERFLLPRRNWFTALVRQIVGTAPSEREVLLAGFCIHSPLIHLHEMRSRPRPCGCDPAHGSPLADPATLVETIYTFALAGLRELRCRRREETR
jgi:AcrR family transcriptional regulator